MKRPFYIRKIDPQTRMGWKLGFSRYATVEAAERVAQDLRAQDFKKNGEDAFLYVVQEVSK